MAFSWRQKAFHPYRRLIPTILFAALVYVGFGVASIFSSRVTTNTGNEVLLSGTNCGILTEENTEAYTYDQYITLLAPYETQRSIAYSTYALQCYSNTSSLGDPACQYYVKPRMPFTTIRNASCPFAKEICNDAAGNLLLDSGFLDSHHDFGVNAPKKDRFQFRMVNHCAPLVTEGYSSLHDNSNNPTIPVKRYYYGERTLNSLGDKGNFTYETQVNFSSLALEGGNSRSAPLSDYTLGCVFSSYLVMMTRAKFFSLGIYRHYGVTIRPIQISSQYHNYVEMMPTLFFFFYLLTALGSPRSSMILGILRTLIPGQKLSILPLETRCHPMCMMNRPVH